MTTPVWGKIALSFLCVLCMGINLLGQNKSVHSDSWQEALLAPLDYSSNKLPTESIYIQTSKDIYESQEDLWFKAYVLNAQSLQPSFLSRTLYVQLVREESDSVVWQEKYEIDEGMTEGHIFLADSLPSGTYLLTAFTPHSFSFNSPNIYAVRKIEVIDFIQKYSKDFPLIDKDSIQFSLFPEGGNLVVGLSNKVAFKATEKEGRPMSVSGVLFEDGAQLLRFRSAHAGMGNFSFIPREEKHYQVQLDDRLDTSYLLPEIQKAGIVMHLAERDAQNLVFHISRNPSMGSDTIYLRTQIRGEAHSIATGVIDTSLIFKVPLDNMPQGIAEVTLFNEHFIPVAERLVYVDQDQELIMETTLSKKEPSKREKMIVTIKVSDQHGAPVSTTLGISISESIFKNPANPSNILSHYYLSSQIRGKVYDAAYYFDRQNADRHQALDMLLLTQGWRRYVWSQSVLQELGYLVKTPIIDGIKGSIQPRKKHRREKVNYPTLLAYVPEKNLGDNIIEVNSNGGFMVEPDHLKIGEGGFTYIKYFPYDDSKFDIDLNDNAFHRIDSLRKSSAIMYPIHQRKRQIFENNTIPLRSGADVVQLDEIVVKARKRRQDRRDKYFGKLDSIAKLELTNDYVCRQNLLNCPTHRGDPSNRKPVEGEIYMILKIWDENLQTFVVANGPPIGPFINPPLPPYRYPKLTDAFLLDNFNIVRTKGYYGYREFYQPDHEELYDPAPDYRNTLLWAPRIKTDEHGEATITFFCSDLPGLFKADIEGVSNDGILGHKSFEFVVEN